MAITSSYPIAAPTANDTLVGTKFIEKKEPATSSFNIGDLANFIAGYISVSPINLGVANGLSLTGATLSLGLASGSANGALSSANWTTFNNKQNALSGTGIVKCTGSTVSYITDGSADWNTAYSNSITSIAVTGTTTKTLTLNRQNASALTASWVDGGGGAIGIGSPANGLSIVDDFLYIALASSSTIGALSSTDWNTFNSKQAPLTFSAPLSNTSNTVSIPVATSTVSGYLTSTNWNTFNNKQAALSGSGLVKSTAGTISYLTDNSANWDTAYNKSITTAAVTGTTTKTLTLTQQNGGTVAASWTDDGGSVTVGAISGTSTANGVSITSNVLNLAPADGTNGGILTSGIQTIGGAKTFTNGFVVNASNNFNSNGSTFNQPSGNTNGGATVAIQGNQYGYALRFLVGTTAFDTGACQFRNNGTDVGTIGTTSTSTSYNTSSDYRLKENIEPIVNSLDRVDSLQPCRFNFIIEPTRVVDGFIAHEVQAVVPEAVTGVKDAVDQEGAPMYQGIDQAKLVPLLTAAIQELHAKVKALELLVNP